MPAGWEGSRPSRDPVPENPTSREPTTLRRCVLAVAVLHDVDLVPCAEGVVLTADPARRDEGPLVTWEDVAEAVGADDPDSPAARTRVAGWLRVRRTLAALPADAVAGRVRALGMARGHVLHPGHDWVAQSVPGGSLDLGFGVVGVDDDVDAVQPAAPRLLRHAGIDAAISWPAAGRQLEEEGARAAERLADEHPVLRAVGSADVVTLLGSATYRAALVEGSGGMRTVAVPMRTRGWMDLRRVDPAFVLAAAAAVEPENAGFPRPLLVTRDEVTMVAAGGDPTRTAFDDAP